MSIAFRIAAAPLLSFMLAAPHAVARAEVSRAAHLSVEQRAVHDDAVRSFRERRYAAAYARFARLADAGHAPSAQLAWAMHANGATLFGNDWFATAAQQRRWHALLADETVVADDPSGD